MTLAARAVIVAAYTAVFWLALPVSLWKLARALDRTLGWEREPWWGGVPVLASGLALLFWGMVELWRAGRGLPVGLLPPGRLVTSGPYRFVRHPMYLGFNLAVLGTGLLSGSDALAWIVAPGFLPLWLAYALVEERPLARRSGETHRRYRRRVGLFPRIPAYRLAQLVQALGLFPVRVRGREHIPARGPVILAWNHACYLDPLFVGVATRRVVCHLATAEAFRGGMLRWLVRFLGAIPVRRYRPDPVACREMIRLLADGEVVGIAPEGERSPLGDYLGARTEVAAVLARLPVPVVPVGITGAYDCGPRWSGVLRRRPVSVRVGPPVRWASLTRPAETLDAGIRALLDADPQPVHLAGLPPERLERVLWRCPSCLEERGWRAPALSCAGCGARYDPTADGRLAPYRAGSGLADAGGALRTLAELGHAVRGAPESGRLLARVTAWRERSMFGSIEPLEPLGGGELCVSPDGLQLGELFVPLGAIRSTSTERSDTLQIATRDAMWQFRLAAGSPFRLQLAVDRWRGASRPGPPRTAAARVARAIVGAAGGGVAAAPRAWAARAGAAARVPVR